MVGPPDAAWRLGDALKTEFFAPGAALKSHGRLFQRRLNNLPQPLKWRTKAAGGR
jgi:hypothetical protein